MNKEKLYTHELIQSDVINKNGRLYPREVLNKAIEKYDKECIKNQLSFGELEHPESIAVSLKKVSHLITKIYWGIPRLPRKLKKKMKKLGIYKKNSVYVKYKILNTPTGKLAKKFIRDLVPAPRGMGSIRDGIIQDNYELLAIDLIKKEEKS